MDAERKNEEDQSVVGFSKQIKFPDPLCYSDFFNLTRTAAALCKQFSLNARVFGLKIPRRSQAVVKGAVKALR